LGLPIGLLILDYGYWKSSFIEAGHL